MAAPRRRPGRQDARNHVSFEQILGIHFFNGTAAKAVALMTEQGGLLVAPSGTCFERFQFDANYRRAILTADLVLPDSGFMVLLWRILRRGKLRRVSGLRYFRQLLAAPAFETRQTFWVLPNERARERLLAWASAKGLTVAAESCYVAPMFGLSVQDDQLLGMLNEQNPTNIVIGLGAGAQEKLGWFLREYAAERRAIYCIGAALGFITGDQRGIPEWADRLYLGWLLRLARSPKLFFRRLWLAHGLPGLIARYGEQLPPLRAPE